MSDGVMKEAASLAAKMIAEEMAADHDTKRRIKQVFFQKLEEETKNMVKNIVKELRDEVEEKLRDVKKDWHDEAKATLKTWFDAHALPEVLKRVERGLDQMSEKEIRRLSEIAARDRIETILSGSKLTIDIGELIEKKVRARVDDDFGL